MKRFIEVIGEFANSTIDQEEEKGADKETTSWEDTMARRKILQLKGNTIPCWLVPLERIFNKDGGTSKSMAPEMDDQVEECNIDSEDEP